MNENEDLWRRRRRDKKSSRGKKINIDTCNMWGNWTRDRDTGDACWLERQLKNLLQKEIFDEREKGCKTLNRIAS